MAKSKETAHSGHDLSDSNVLAEILNGLRSLQEEHAKLASAVKSISERMTALDISNNRQEVYHSARSRTNLDPEPSMEPDKEPVNNFQPIGQHSEQNVMPTRRASATSKIILTSYPGQAGVDPLAMSWGHPNPAQRGPVVVSRQGSTIRRRNGKKF